MKRVVLGLMTIVLFFGCKPKIPDGIIEQNKMQDILYDIHLVDGYLSSIYVQDSARKVGSAYYNGIYKKYDTDSARYNQSLKYYNNKPELLQEMYTRISKKMENQKAGMKIADSLLLRKKFKTDSLKIIKTFKADSLAIRKKMKTDSSSKAKADTQIKKKKAQADSLLNTKRNSSGLQLAPTAVQ